MNHPFYIIIPAKGEPDLISTLQSLRSCSQFDQTPVTILVFINAIETDENTIHDINLKNIEKINAQDWPFEIQVIHQLLPERNGGVGLARRTAMSLAIEDAKKKNLKNALFVNLDGDCAVQENYLNVLQQAANLNLKAGTLYFEHPITTHNHPIVDYELFLRYQTNVLRWAGYPYAFHTVGSSFFVDMQTYLKVGEMNDRKAGEDFYFLHKVMRFTPLTDLVGTTVYPSARSSERVAFGTGKSMKEMDQTKAKTYYTYHFETFKHLKPVFDLFKKAGGFTEWSEGLQRLSSESQTVLSIMKIEVFAEQCEKRTNSAQAFQRQMMEKLSGFNIIKMIHLYRDLFFTNQPVEKAVRQLLAMSGFKVQYLDKLELLNLMRKIDKRDLEWSFTKSYASL